MDIDKKKGTDESYKNGKAKVEKVQLRPPRIVKQLKSYSYEAILNCLICLPLKYIGFTLYSGDQG